MRAAPNNRDRTIVCVENECNTKGEMNARRVSLQEIRFGGEEEEEREREKSVRKECIWTDDR